MVSFDYSLVFSWIIPALLFVFTILGGIFYLIPRLVISEGQQHTAEDGRLAIPFSLSNGGYLTIQIQNIVCWVEDLESDQHSRMSHIALLDRSGGTLEAGESVEYEPNLPPVRLAGKIIRGELLLVVRYKQRFWPVKMEKRARFSIRRNRDGKLQYFRPYLTDEWRRLVPDDDRVHTVFRVR